MNINDSIKKLEEIKTRLEAIDLAQKLEPKKAEEYIKDIEQVGKLIKPDVYDNLLQLLESIEGKFTIPDRDLDETEMKNMSDLLKKYKEVILPLNKKKEVIEEYKERFDINELISDKENELLIKKEKNEDKQKKRNYINAILKDPTFVEQSKKLETINSNISKLNDIENKIEEIEKIQEDINNLKNNDSLDNDVKQHQIQRLEAKKNIKIDLMNTSIEQLSSENKEIKIGKISDISEINNLKANISVELDNENKEKDNTLNKIDEFKSQIANDFMKNTGTSIANIQPDKLKDILGNLQTVLHTQIINANKEIQKSEETINNIKRSENIISGQRRRMTQEEYDATKEEFMQDEDFKRNVDKLAEQKLDQDYNSKHIFGKTAYKYRYAKAVKQNQGEKIGLLGKIGLGLRAFFSGNEKVKQKLLEEAKDEKAREQIEAKNDLEKSNAEETIKKFKEKYAYNVTKNALESKDLEDTKKNLEAKSYEDIEL